MAAKARTMSGALSQTRPVTGASFFGHRPARARPVMLIILQAGALGMVGGTSQPAMNLRLTCGRPGDAHDCSPVTRLSAVKAQPGINRLSGAASLVKVLSL